MDLGVGGGHRLDFLGDGIAVSVYRAAELEVGIKGQNITVRGYCPPSDERSYRNDQEIILDLPLARELHRLLGKLIPLAEQSQTTAKVVPLSAERSA
jgi:hypothetical protein